jgi:hypothetical protein
MESITQRGNTAGTMTAPAVWLNASALRMRYFYFAAVALKATAACAISFATGSGPDT